MADLQLTESTAAIIKLLSESLGIAKEDVIRRSLSILYHAHDIHPSRVLGTMPAKGELPEGITRIEGIIEENANGNA